MPRACLAIITVLSAAFGVGALAQTGSTASCCGKKPQFQDVPGYSTLYSTFTGQVAVATCFSPNATDPSLVVLDLKNQASAPIDSNWSSSSIPPVQFFHHPAWTKANLGDVFGVTLDDNGNVYVAASTAYGSNSIGAIGAGRGGIYKLDTFTGNPTAFVSTVNAASYQISQPNKIPNTGPGLGNLTWDCVHQNFYVSNFEDGLIYRIDIGGNILSMWDHGANLPTAIPSSAALPDDPNQQYTQLGRRPWAVQVYNGRLYYSLWNEDQGRPNATKFNEIWSVGLAANGGFVGPAQREIIIPHLPASTYSSPVADIKFGPSGQMLLAERTMTGDISVYAHSSRCLEYVLSGSTWIPSATTYKIGAYGTQTNSAGGCAYDFSPGGRVWTTGDALHFNVNDFIYGIQGTPAVGGDNTTSILIDLNENITVVDKTRIGDVVIPCTLPSVPTGGCCDGKPNYDNQAYTSTFTGQVAVATSFSYTGPVVSVIDIKNCATAPIGIQNWAPAMYHPAAWTAANLGQVFGLALDPAGNIFVGSTGVYATDTWIAGQSEAVYKISIGSGAISTFKVFSNDQTGLGNLCYDCDHSKMYVTDFDDGLIYELDPTTGATLGTWDHGANLPTATQATGPPAAEPAIPDIPTQTYTPLGRRPWGVREYQGRLYYGIWWEDTGRPNAARSNEVWSIALSATGAFVPPARREIQLPPITGQNYSNPPSDIAFGPAGTMLVAERSMFSDTLPTAHQSRALEYTQVAGVWTLLNPTKYQISQAYPPGSSAGGCDYQYGGCGRVWVTGDALHLGYSGLDPNIYGIQALPSGGGDWTNSILVDLDGNTVTQNKTEIGDVRISCPPGPVPTADFTATTVCQGQPTVFTDASTGATSWAWNFGDAGTSVLQNPTHTYATSGVFNVTLCINGGSPCITHTVTVLAAPAPPVIVGPADTCAGFGAYSITPVAGETYSWTVVGGTPASGTGPNINITWNPTGPYTITVTATNQGKCQTKTTITIKDCGTHIVDCCKNTVFDTNAPTVTNLGGGLYSFSQTLFASPYPVSRVVATIINTTRTFVPASCGTSGSANSYITAAGAVPGFGSTLPVAFSRESLWYVTGGPISLTGGVAFPMTIQFPPPPSWPCSDTISFCVRYEFTFQVPNPVGTSCETCEFIKCYGPYKRGGKIIWNQNPTGAIAGQVITPAPVAMLVDDNGNPIQNVKGTLNVAIKPGTGTTGANLSGTLTADFVNGVATFPNLSIDKPGTGYVLTTWNSDFPDGADSNPFNVSMTGLIGIYPAGPPIVIDGNITPAEWSGATVLTMNNALFDVLPGNWTGPADLSAQLLLKWDTQNLYFAEFIGDSVLSLPSTTDLTMRDGMSLFLGVNQPQLVTRVAYDTPGDYNITISADSAAGGLPPAARWFSPQWGDTVNGPTSNVKFTPVSGGYTMEGQIPWSLLNCCNFTAFPGEILGFNYLARDNDQTTPNQDTIFSLTGLSGSETTPNAWTQAILLSGGTLAGDVNLDGKVDAKDVVLAEKMASGQFNSANPAASFANADVNHDGIIDIKDVVKISRSINGL